MDIDARTVEFVKGTVRGIGPVGAEIRFEAIDSYLTTTPNWESEIEVTGMARQTAAPKDQAT